MILSEYVNRYMLQISIVIIETKNDSVDILFVMTREE